MQSLTVITFVLLSLFKICYCDSDIETSPPNGTIFYYAYGSNLLTKRMHINNPSAVYYGIAKLKNYRLDFNMFVNAWQGAVATIVEDDDEEVWGVVWTLNADDVQYLDEQEGVSRGWYFAKNVTVTTPSGQRLIARTYEEITKPNKTGSSDIAFERRPSSTYLEVIALGAIEQHLSPEYIGFIFSFPTNGKLASKERRQELGYPF